MSSFIELVTAVISDFLATDLTTDSSISGSSFDEEGLHCNSLSGFSGESSGLTTFLQE